MQNKYNWYILYTKTNAENRAINGIIEAFRKRRLAYHFEPFCPETEYYYRSKQTQPDGTNYRMRLLFPNYIFVETDMPEVEFIKSFQRFIFDSSDIIRLLKYNETHIALDPNEKARLEYLFDDGRSVRHSVGKILYGDIIVEHGPLKGKEALITHVNRHNRAATVNLDLFGAPITTHLALEITEKIA